MKYFIIFILYLISRHDATVHYYWVQAEWMSVLFGYFYVMLELYLFVKYVLILRKPKPSYLEAFEDDFEKAV